MNANHLQLVRRRLILALVSLMINPLLTVNAGLLTLSESPLFLGIRVIPNVFIELDDSGSMDWEILTQPHWAEYCYNRYSLKSNSTEGNQSTSCTTMRTDGALYLTVPNGSTSTTPSRDTYHYVLNCQGDAACKDSDGTDSDNAYQPSTCLTGSYYSLANCSALYADQDWRARSAALNVMFYNPAVTYTRWIGLDANDPRYNADFTSARSNPMPTAPGYNHTRDLTGFYYYIWLDKKGYVGSNPKRGTNINDGTTINVTNTSNGVVDLWDSRLKVTVRANDVLIQEINCTLNTVNGDPQEGRLNCAVVRTATYAGMIPAAELGLPAGSPGRTVAEEKQNIAYWYQYYRRRMLTAKAAVASLLNSASNYRYGLTPINCNGTVVNCGAATNLFVEFPPPNPQMPAGFDFAGHNATLLTKLFQYPQTSRSTPLPPALDLAGKYYSNRTGRPNPILHDCQQNFTLLTTDGYWNVAYSGTIGDQDGDSKSVTLADVAKYYYATDLYPPASNDKVPPVPGDAAQHQHMVTFGIAFGAQGKLVDTNGDGWPEPPVLQHNLSDPSAVFENYHLAQERANWGDPINGTGCSSGDCADKIDDLWHAAYNSRGFFASARTPQELADGLKNALRQIKERLSTAAASSVNASVYLTGTQAFQALFNSADWSGQLVSLPLNANGTLGNQSWDAGAVIDTQPWAQRQIITYDPVQQRGIPFRWGNLNPQQQGFLNTDPKTNQPDTKGTSRLEFLRGRGADLNDPTSSEITQAAWVANNQFRLRSSKLGDIVQSDPIYVGRPGFEYPDTLEAASYTDFRLNQYGNRDPIIYVGANDGMLHGFNAKPDPANGGGREVMAYVPSKVMKRLNLLTDPEYAHRYYVDGQLTVGDAFFGGSWHTVLVSGLRVGGQSYFALDITNPVTLATAEQNATNVALWEFNDTGNPPAGGASATSDADLGYSFSKPVISRMANNQWVAIFGNGYNNTEPDGVASATGNAVLYIVDIQTGQLVRKLDTGSGLNDPDQPNRANPIPNGLGSPTAVDVDDDYRVDYIYAGDLLGHLWKFDVRAANPGQWSLAYGPGKPLFKAVNDLNQRQPITVRPAVDSHPSGQGYLIYFGTGKYIEDTDNQVINQPTQSLYGVWDRNELVDPQNPLSALKEPSPYPSRTNLLKQWISSEPTSPGGFKVRLTSDQAITWFDLNGQLVHLGWYMDLALANNNGGEKVIVNPVLRNKQIIFTTLLPSDNPCDFGGSSWLMVLNGSDGSRLPVSAFDFSGDFKFDQNDLINGEVASGRSTSDVGIVGRPALLTSGNAIITVLCGAKGRCEGASVGGGAPPVPPPAMNPGLEDTGRQSWRQP